jgi:hypothetical protein
MAPDEAAKPDVALRQWLRSLGLEQYAESCERKDVGLELLPNLSHADLEKLGLTLGHRERLLKALAGLQPAASSLVADNQQGTSATALEAERRQLTVLFCGLGWLHSAL